MGDSSDSTEAVLRARAEAEPEKDITVLRVDTGITGEEPHARLRRLSMTVNPGLDAVQESDGYVLIHESDLISPDDLVERFLASEHCPVGGWVTLGEGGVFYDTWAYRTDGRMWSNGEKRPDEPVQCDSVGSCWLMYAEDIRAGMRCSRLAVLDLAQQMRDAGREFWCDPSVEIVQPLALWTSRAHAR